MQQMHHQYQVQHASTHRGAGSSSSDDDEYDAQDDESEEGQHHELHEDEDGKDLMRTSEDATQKDTEEETLYDVVEEGAEFSPDWEPMDGSQNEPAEEEPAEKEPDFVPWPVQQPLVNLQEDPEEADPVGQGKHGLATTNTASDAHAILHEAPAYADGDLPEAKRVCLFDIISRHCAS